MPHSSFTPPLTRSFLSKYDLESELNRLAALSFRLSRDSFVFRPLRLVRLSEPDAQGVNWTIGSIEGEISDHVLRAVDHLRLHYNMA